MRQKDWLENERLPKRDPMKTRPQRVPPKKPDSYTDTGIMHHDREKREFDDFEGRYPGLRGLLNKHSKTARRAK